MGQPPCCIPIVAVDFCQHAVGCLEIAGPSWWQPRPMRQGLDEHGLSDLSRLDSCRCSPEIRIESPHKAQLQQYLISFGSSDHLVALFDGQRHRLLAEDMYPSTGCDHR